MSEQTGQVEFGRFRRRLIAAMLDCVVWLVGISYLFSGRPFQDNRTAAAIAGLVVLSAWFNYFAICEWKFGQTIGKNAFGLRVVPVDAGAKLTYNAAAIRNLLRLVDFPLTLIGVDYLIVRDSPRRQRLGDRAAKTVVLRERSGVPRYIEPEAPAEGGPSSGELFGDASAALGARPKPPDGEEGS